MVLGNFISQEKQTMTNEAQQAIHAAKHKHIWGRHAALRYIQRRYIPIGLYRLACQLEAGVHL